MTTVPSVDGVITADEIRQTAEHIASLQLPTGMIPWFPGGHCDPWNHVETAMALDTAGLHDHAAHAYEWLVDIQRPDGSWWNYYFPDGSVEEAKLDTNVCAYVATGAWHHWRLTRSGAFLDRLWPTVQRSLDWVLSMRRADGSVLWACEEHERPWDYALLTGSSSIAHALRCGVRLAEAAGEPRADWVEAASRLAALVADSPHAFEPKERWAMDWYYPVLAGCLTGERAVARLAAQWDEFAMDRLGIRCVSDESWVTASETAECSIAHAVVGDVATAAALLRWPRPPRLAAGSYLTGIVYPSGETFPPHETSAYTAAAVILAADAIGGGGVFVAA
ncbi:MAG: prenyltransferase/squalene oxidase repeat-containing protein [Ilumatobacteraceae bacterium]